MIGCDSGTRTVGKKDMEHIYIAGFEHSPGDQVVAAHPIPRPNIAQSSLIETFVSYWYIETSEKIKSLTISLSLLKRMRQ